MYESVSQPEIIIGCLLLMVAAASVVAFNVWIEAVKDQKRFTNRFIERRQR